MFDRKEYMKKYWKEHGHNAERYPEIRKRYLFKKKYGITPEEYEVMKTAQEGRCAICCEIPEGKPLCVDHDHKTNVVRGLLCSNCNSALGFLKHDPGILIIAIEYLRSTNVEEVEDHG